MPHQFEIITSTDILYFLPSGVLDKSGTFVDFPRQSGPECWDHAMRRLASMYYTQTPFNIENESELFKVLDKIKREFLEIELWKKFSELLIHSIIKVCSDEIELAKYVFQQCKTLAEIVKTAGETFETKFKMQTEFSQEFFKSIVANQAKADMFVKDCIQLVDNIVQLTNREHEHVVQMFIDYYATHMCELFDNAFQPGKYLYNCLPEHNKQDAVLSILKNHPNLAYKAYKYKEMLFEYSRFAFDLGYIELSLTQNKNQFLHTFIRNNGAFVVEGFVGEAFYNQPPKKVATFGSVDLLGFPANSYQEDAHLHGGINIKFGHVVIVIGIYKGRVIYQDPSCDSLANGPRTAFIMDADKFIERVALFHKLNERPKIECIILDPNRVDATTSLMLKQTGVSNTLSKPKNRPQ